MTRRAVIRDGYVAWWRGGEYEAGPAAGGEIRLYTDAPTEGFDEIRPGRHRRIVSRDELDDLRYVRTLCTWQDEPFIVLAEHESWLRVEYAGGKVPVAERLGLDRIDLGIWQAWASRTEVNELRQEFT